MTLNIKGFELERLLADHIPNNIWYTTLISNRNFKSPTLLVKRFLNYLCCQTSSMPVFHQSRRLVDHSFL